MFQKRANPNTTPVVPPPAPKASSNKASSGMISFIGPDVHIIGNVIARNEIQVDGQIDGDVACKKMVVGEGACLRGEITAEHVRVHGEIRGKIDAEIVMVARTGCIIGDICHTSLEIEAGAQLEGRLLRRSSGGATTEPQKAIAAPVLPVTEPVA